MHLGPVMIILLSWLVLTIFYHMIEKWGYLCVVLGQKNVLNIANIWEGLSSSFLSTEMEPLTYLFRKWCEFKSTWTYRMYTTAYFGRGVEAYVKSKLASGLQCIDCFGLEVHGSSSFWKKMKVSSSYTANCQFTNVRTTSIASRKFLMYCEVQLAQ